MVQHDQRHKFKQLVIRTTRTWVRRGERWALKRDVLRTPVSPSVVLSAWLAPGQRRYHIELDVDATRCLISARQGDYRVSVSDER